jgi:hypothetical protein
VPSNNEMELTRSAMGEAARPSQLISVFDGASALLKDPGSD